MKVIIPRIIEKYFLERAVFLRQSEECKIVLKKKCSTMFKRCVAFIDSNEHQTDNSEADDNEE